MLLKKLSAALQLSLQFLCMMVRSGVDTLLLIIKLQIKLKKSLKDTYICVEIPNLNDVGLVVLGCLISLTPGTTLLNLNNKNNELLLHLLDGEHADKTLQEIKQKFEPYLIILFHK